jgi:hypothetical protein
MNLYSLAGAGGWALVNCSLHLAHGRREACAGAHLHSAQRPALAARPASVPRPPRVQVNANMVKLMSGARTSLAGELDGKYPDALRNLLFGSFGEDLFTRNAFRSLEVGMQPYAELAKCFGVTPDAKVRFAGSLRAAAGPRGASCAGPRWPTCLSRPDVMQGPHELNGRGSPHGCTDRCVCTCSPDESSLAPQC